MERMCKNILGTAIIPAAMGFWYRFLYFDCCEMFIEGSQWVKSPKKQSEGLFKQCIQQKKLTCLNVPQLVDFGHKA